MADSATKNNVPDMVTNSHKETSSPWTHETHEVASQKQLEGARVPRKNDTFAKVTPPRLRMVAGGKQCASRSTISPTEMCCADVYRCIIRRVGRLRKHAHSKRHLVGSRSKLHINCLELKEVLLSLKEFQDLCENNIILEFTDNTTVVAYINKESGMRSGPLCALLWIILIWCINMQVTQSLTHSRPAKCDSRQAIQTRPDHPDRMVSPPGGFPGNMSKVAPSSGGPFCNQVKK